MIPAFKVDYGKGGFKPLTVKEKFQEWAKGAYDPLGLGAGAVEAATLEHSSTDGFCGYGEGWSGYGKCFGALELDANISSFIGDFALTSLWHQDPRYFRMGEGSFGRRLWYAVTRVFVTLNDSGHTVFYSSAITGTVAAAGISNLYYPEKDRTVRVTPCLASLSILAILPFTTRRLNSAPTSTAGFLGTRGFAQETGNSREVRSTIRNASGSSGSHTTR